MAAGTKALLGAEGEQVAASVPQRLCVRTTTTIAVCGHCTYMSAHYTTSLHCAQQLFSSSSSIIVLHFIVHFLE